MKKVYFFLFLFIIIGSMYGLELYNLDSYILELNTFVMTRYDINISDGSWFFNVPSCEIEIEAEKDNSCGLQLEVDFSEAYEDNPAEIISTASIWFKPVKNLTLTIGQQKLPFGTEMNIGKANRPYAMHFETSRNLCPGRDRGLIASYNNFVDFFDIDISISNGQGIDAGTSLFNSIMGTGNLKAAVINKKKLSLDISYSFLYLWKYIYLKYTDLGQAISCVFEMKPAKKQSLFFLAEYIERISFSEAINTNTSWNYGIMTALSYTIKSIGPFAAFEYYRDNTADAGFEDFLSFTAGVNLSPFKITRFSLFYTWERIIPDAHGISAVIWLKI